MFTWFGLTPLSTIFQYELQPFFIWKMCVFFDKIWREKKIAARHQ
jgi:hypothetical protein